MSARGYFQFPDKTSLQWFINSLSGSVTELDELQVNTPKLHVFVAASKALLPEIARRAVTCGVIRNTVELELGNGERINLDSSSPSGDATA